MNFTSGSICSSGLDQRPYGAVCALNLDWRDQCLTWQSARSHTPWSPSGCCGKLAGMGSAMVKINSPSASKTYAPRVPSVLVSELNLFIPVAWQHLVVKLELNYRQGQIKTEFIVSHTITLFSNNSYRALMSYNLNI